MDDNANQTLSGTGKFKHLLLNTLSGTTLTSDMHVEQLFNINNGILHTGNFTLILDSGATAQNNGNGDDWIDGNMQQYYVAGNSSAWFLIGDNVDYYPISLTVDATVGGGVRASAIAGDDANISSSNIDAAKSVNRHWKIDSAGVELSGLSVTLNWQPADIDAGADWNLFEVSKLHDGIWTPLTVTNRTATSITASYTGNQLSTFQVGQPVCIINIPDANF
ncbi:MAG: hypothetical protein IPO27_05735 [Bacteroidetes bacterium]|nr:hypothetical protein [Bacteroidota bacterium]